MININLYPFGEVFGILTLFFASFLVWFMLAGFFAYWVIVSKFKNWEVLHILTSALLSWFLSEFIIKHIVGSGRPFIEKGLTPLTLTIPSGASFPSSHTAFAFGLSVAIYLHDKKAGFVFLTLSLLIGLGRIFGNVHFPIDIVGGVILGAFIALLTDQTIFRHKKT